MKTSFAGAFAALFCLTPPLSAQEKGIDVALVVDKDITSPTPVCVPLTVTKAEANWTAVVSGKTIGQLAAPGLLTDGIKATGDGVRRDLFLILEDRTAAGTKLKFNFTPRDGSGKTAFHWKDTRGDHTDLLLGDRPVLRYMYKAYDTSSEDNRNKTYKPFHHLFDPSGKRLVTNGGHTDEGVKDPKKLVFPHHRGLQFGFMKVTYDNGKKTADTWHCRDGAFQSHEGFLHAEAGSIMGRHCVAIDWHGKMKEVMVKEEREMTVYNLPGGTMVDFVSRLTPVGGKVKLDGDPQHAGFQFRAANAVSDKEFAKQTYYLRPDGKGKPGETRNWDPKTQKGPVDLPWDAMSFVLGGDRYTVCYIDRPSNPRSSRYSERDYGRFGCYFVQELTPGKPLTVNYRVWMQKGEMAGAQVQALSNEFVSPPRAQ